MPKPIHYTVKKGDTLSALAAKFMGDPHRWPEIWHFNNKAYSSPEVKSRIKPYVVNPDSIFVGQHILIPVDDDRQRETRNPRPSVRDGDGNGFRSAIERAPLPGLKFDLYNLGVMEYSFSSPCGGYYKATVRLAGYITLQKREPVDFVKLVVSAKDLDLSNVVYEYVEGLHKLTSAPHCRINPQTGEFECYLALVYNSGTPFPITFRTGFSTSVKEFELPRYKSSLSIMNLKGHIEGIDYSVDNLKVAVEIEYHPTGMLLCSAQTMFVANAAGFPRSPSRDWISGGLVGVGVIVGVGLVGLLVLNAETVATLITVGFAVNTLFKPFKVHLEEDSYQ